MVIHSPYQKKEMLALECILTNGNFMYISVSAALYFKV